MKSFNINFISSGGWLLKIADELERRGHKMNGPPDFIIGMTHSMSDEIIEAERRLPEADLILYNWDMYEWKKNEEQEIKFAALMKRAKEVWCPSECTVQRMKEWYGLSNGIVLKTYIPYYDEETTDGDYVLNPLRELPDRCLGWVERACEELNIPCVSPNHQLSQAEWQQKVANCSFMVSAYYEASTGGLSLVEGYYLGKLSVISNSPYHGGKDYLPVAYFQYDDYEDLKRVIGKLWIGRPKLNKGMCQSFVRDHYSVEVMVNNIERRLYELRGIPEEIH